MPIFGDPLGSRTFAPSNFSRSVAMPLMGSDTLSGGPIGGGIGSNNSFLFNLFKKLPPKPGTGFGFNAGPGIAVNSNPAPAPNYGPLASSFSQLFTPQPPQTANPFQYF